MSRNNRASGPPTWLTSVAPAVQEQLPDWFAEFVPPPNPRRRSAVLMAFSEAEHGRDVILTERSSTLRSHASQVSFPGGHLDADDADARAAAIREAEEEVGLE
ncbi:MAG: NUDIX domain-containing protein, partial [Mobilicoccus sp.]|nr:NUDIX domain-containing protein [Mobilicoccus sp.]